MTHAEEQGTAQESGNLYSRGDTDSGPPALPGLVSQRQESSEMLSQVANHLYSYGNTIKRAGSNSLSTSQDLAHTTPHERCMHYPKVRGGSLIRCDIDMKDRSRVGIGLTPPLCICREEVQSKVSSMVYGRGHTSKLGDKGRRTDVQMILKV